MAGANGRGRRSFGRSDDRSGPRRLGPSATRPVNGSNAVHITIPSDFVSGCMVQQQIIDEAEKLGFDYDSIFGIKLAVDEALINAIKHGNKLDPSKRVHVEASISPRRLEVIIEDEGTGFDRQSVPDPTSEDNLHKPSGRGILLMEAYMDRVEWSLGGRRVRMVKTLAAKEAGKAAEGQKPK